MKSIILATVVISIGLLHGCGAGLYARPYSTSSTDFNGNNYFAPANACLAIASVYDYAPTSKGSGNFHCKEYNVRANGYYVADIHCRYDVCNLVTARAFSRY